MKAPCSLIAGMRDETGTKQGQGQELHQQEPYHQPIGQEQKGKPRSKEFAMKDVGTCILSLSLPTLGIICSVDRMMTFMSQQGSIQISRKLDLLSLFSEMDRMVIKESV